jgi:hypothetical protein
MGKLTCESTVISLLTSWLIISSVDVDVDVSSLVIGVSEVASVSMVNIDKGSVSSMQPLVLINLGTEERSSRIQSRNSGHGFAVSLLRK